MQTIIGRTDLGLYHQQRLWTTAQPRPAATEGSPAPGPRAGPFPPPDCPLAVPSLPAHASAGAVREMGGGAGVRFRLAAQKLEARYRAAGHVDRLDEHRRRPHPEAAIAILLAIDHERLERFAVAGDAEHGVLVPLVVAIAAGRNGVHARVNAPRGNSWLSDGRSYGILPPASVTGLRGTCSRRQAAGVDPAEKSAGFSRISRFPLPSARGKLSRSTGCWFHHFWLCKPLACPGIPMKHSASDAGIVATAYDSSRRSDRSQSRTISSMLFAAGIFLPLFFFIASASVGKDSSPKESDDRAIQLELKSLLANRRFEEAEDVAARALAASQKQSGEESSEAARWHLWLGRVTMARQNTADAAGHLETAIAITKKKSPKEEIAAECLDEMGNLLCLERRFDEAKTLFEKGLEIRESLYGDNSLELIVSLDNLARCNRLMRKYEEAEPLLKKALEIRERRLGPEHRSTAISLRSLGDLKRARWEYAAARPLLQKALEIRERVLGPDDPLTAESLHDMASLYHDQDRPADAEPLYKRSLTIRLQRLGPNHPETLSTVTALAKLYREMDREEVAERLELDPAAFLNIKVGDASTNGR